MGSSGLAATGSCECRVQFDRQRERGVQWDRQRKRGLQLDRQHERGVQFDRQREQSVQLDQQREHGVQLEHSELSPRCTGGLQSPAQRKRGLQCTSRI